jgi:hypothetical protein
MLPAPAAGVARLAQMRASIKVKYQCLRAMPIVRSSGSGALGDGVLRCYSTENTEYTDDNPLRQSSQAMHGLQVLQVRYIGNFSAHRPHADVDAHALQVPQHPLLLALPLLPTR